LPHQTIVPVRRAEPSGDTFVFTQFLDFSTQTWEYRVGFGTAVPWPEVVGGKTATGNEGMVVKPIDFIAISSGKSKRFVQPAIKSRGPEYLRIIYGPEYTLPENLLRLKSRGLGAKRSFAPREFALGLEA